MEQIIILGLGNILYGDEGFGVLLAQRLYAHWDFPENVEVVDGGTQGQTLLTFVERADRLLVLDAVDFGLEPGEIAAVVGAVAAEADQEAGQVAVALGDAEILGAVVEALQLGRIQGQDRLAGVVVERQD